MNAYVKAALQSFAMGALGALLVFLVLSNTAHCSVGKHKNSLGTVMYQDNPMTYKAGAVVAMAYAEEGKGLVLRIQPIGTYDLFTEDILVCNDDATLPMLLNKGNPMVITYRTRASRLVGGLGCHALVHVDGLKAEEVQ